ncbi:MAG: hypothetical protein WCC26_08630 [Terracidiphilus sp.]
MAPYICEGDAKQLIGSSFVAVMTPGKGPGEPLASAAASNRLMGLVRLQ